MQQTVGAKSEPDNSALADLFLLKNKTFLAVFAISYIAIVLFLGPPVFQTVLSPQESGTEIEPFLHYMLRSMHLIDGGVFAGYRSNDCGLITEVFLYPLLPIFVLEALLFKAVITVRTWLSN